MNEENNFTVKVQKLGRVAIPCETRELLKINEGDIVVLEVKKIRHSDDHHSLQEASAQ